MKPNRHLGEICALVVISGSLLVGCAEDPAGTAADAGPITGSTTGGSTAGTTGGSANGGSGGTTTGAANGSSTGPSSGNSNGSSTGTSSGDSSGTSSGDSNGTSNGTSTGIDQDASTPGPGMSPGCGKTTFPASGMYNIDVEGMQRMFIIKLPTTYDPNKPYKLVFGWHSRSTNAASVANGRSGGYYGLESQAADTTIFVAPDASGEDDGERFWTNADVPFARAMYTKFSSEYCIDTERVFAVGFSAGAMMSNIVGSQMGDVFRAIGVISGSSVRGTGTGTVATWIYHGGMDETLGIAGGEAARDFWVKNNHCTTPGPADANGCVQYEGCDAGYPVVWCYEAEGTHRQPSFGSTEIWKFFSQF